MFVPTNNLKAALDETGAEWRAGLERVLERGQFILGPEGERFEQEFAASMGGRYAVGVGSGTAALELCLRCAGIPAGSEVITSPLTAPFTGVAIQAAGMKIRLADIDPDPLQLDARAVANAITRRTRAVMPVHLYGQTCDIPAFRKLARQANAVLIQDAAQAHGARCSGRPLADFSDYIAYSFYPTKNLGALGDGGAVVTNQKSVSTKIKRLRDGGRGSGMVSRVVGINSRLDEVQSAILRAFLPHLQDWNRRRAHLAQLYDEALRGCPGIRIPRRDEGCVYHLYVVRAKNRTGLRSHLAAKGIGTAIHYPVPLHLHSAFRECGLKRGDLPHAEQACREVVTLPLWPQLPADDVLRVAGAVRDFYSRTAR